MRQVRPLFIVGLLRLWGLPIAEPFLRLFYFFLQFIRSMILTLIVRTAFGNSFSAFHHESSTFGADAACWLCLDGIFAVGII